MGLLGILAMDLISDAVSFPAWAYICYFILGMLSFGIFHASN